MKDTQHRKYCICGAQAVKAMRKHGYEGTHSELTAICRIKALGVDKPSRSLSNTEFDSVLAIFAGWHSMSDLGEQLRLLDQPLKRILFACSKLFDKIEMAESGREAYLGGIYKRVQAKRPSRGEQVFSIQDIPDNDFPLVIGALNHTVETKLGIKKPYRSRWKKKTARKPRPEQTNIPF